MVRVGFLCLLGVHVFSTQIHGDFPELFESGFEVFDDFLDEDIRVGEIVGFFEAFISEPEDVEAGFVAVDAIN
jgi:hypothetical protein